MNRFIIERNPRLIAKSLCDQHIVKMPTEEAQMLCTTIWHYAPDYAEEHNLYKPVHQKHPCTLWAMENSSNFWFAHQLYVWMCQEYTIRYDKVHGASKHFLSLFNSMKFLPEGDMTQHPQCFGKYEILKTEEFYPINAYRMFYVHDKTFARYNNGRDRPEWFIDHSSLTMH